MVLAKTSGSELRGGMNRREFIVGAVAGVAAGAAPAAVAPAQDGRILFGACRDSVADVTVMRDLGYDFWEWSAGAAFDPSKDDAWWQTQKEEIAKRPLPLRSCNGFIPGSFRLTGPKADHGPALDYAEKILRRADEIGVKTVVFGSGGARNVPGDFTQGKPPDLEAGTRQYAEFCRALVKRVADLKTVQVVIEPLRPNESNILNYVFQGLAVCRDVASPRLAQLADIFHMMMGREPAESIVRAGEHLKHCHVADWKTRQFPGFDPAQTYRLKPYFDALKAIGYTGGVSCECGWGEKGDLAKNLEKALITMKGLI